MQVRKSMLAPMLPRRLALTPVTDRMAGERKYKAVLAKRYDARAAMEDRGIQGGHTAMTGAAGIYTAGTFFHRFIRRPPKIPALSLLASLLFAGLFLPGGNPSAAPLPSGDEIAQRIDQRDDGRRQVQALRMVLTDRSGAQRIRDTRVFREEFEDGKRTAIFFTGPKRLQGTGFLTWDYHDPARADDQWLYLPAARRVRRISPSDRGDYFLGTDFTYEDVKKNTKLALEDYDFKALGVEKMDGVELYLLEAVPKNQDISRELGYSRLLARVRPDIWMPVVVEYDDIAGNPLKTVRISEIRQHQGIWTPFRIEAENHKTGHHSLFEYLEVSYEEPVDPVLLTTQGLQRGL